MPLSLEDYDHKVGHHVRMLRHHGACMRSHAERMTYQPGFSTLMEDELEAVHVALVHATETVQAALGIFRSKPRDE